MCEDNGGSANDECARRRGFTLLEILLAVALIGLLSAALVSGAAHLVDSRPSTPAEIFWEAVRAARKSALTSEHEVRLSFDMKEKKFVVADGDAQKTFPVLNASDLTVDLLQPEGSGNGMVLIGGQLVDTQTMPAASFYSDGTCSPFRVQFRTNGPAHVIAIDPWTCAPVLTEPKTP